MQWAREEKGSEQRNSFEAHRKEATHGRLRSVPQVGEVNMTQVESETDGLIKDWSWMCWISQLCWLRSHIEKNKNLPSGSLTSWSLLFRVFFF